MTPRTPQPIRILHLEDYGPDREIVRQLLSEHDQVCEFTYAVTEAEFLAALSHDALDVILGDFALPGYSGDKALTAARARRPEVPFIVVSGTVGEERAVDIVKRGATDLVLKHRLERLPPALRRALDEAAARKDRERAERALRESEERFRTLAASVDHVFWIATDGGQTIAYVSPAYQELWGRPISALMVQPEEWVRAVVPEDRPGVRDARIRLFAGEASHLEYRIQRPDGSVRWIEERCYCLRPPAVEAAQVLGVAMDITPRKKLEAQLHQAQKMDAIGQLAGGVAHDFNNVLTIVTGYARLLLDGGTLPPSAVEPVTQIFTAGTRAASLTRQILVFSRKHAVDRRPIDLNDAVEAMAAMLRRLIGEHIRLELGLAPKPASLEADPAMMEQVVLNLAVNARDAMAPGGVLAIRTEQIRITDAAQRGHPSARAGEFVCLSVRDTGCGIPPENLTRIFEPFFTTKEEGRGTGLGLATVFGVVQQHKGWIEVESTVGAGTCFRVLLPALPTASPAATARQSARLAPMRGGSETLLLVEDDPSVREYAVAVLRGQGYRVLQAPSGVDALEVWKWHQSRISLLFSDLVMPEGLGGIELARRLRQEKPTLKVVLASGYAEGTIGEEFAPPPGMHFIHKPYKPQVLTEAVRDALDQSFNR